MLDYVTHNRYKYNGVLLPMTRQSSQAANKIYRWTSKYGAGKKLTINTEKSNVMTFVKQVPHINIAIERKSLEQLQITNI